MTGLAYGSATLLRGALAALAVTLLLGPLGALAGIEPAAALLERAGVDVRVIPTLHTVFATSWLVLAGLAVVVHWLHHEAGTDRLDRALVGVALLLFAVAGAGVLVTVPAGYMSGREYIGFHPALAAPILVGWVALAACFYRHALRGLLERPVYVLMWAVGFALFMVTFVEQYAWLLPDVFSDPIADKRLQWKATGTLVGAYNLFCYGAALYVSERLGGDPARSRSGVSFALFALGLLNTLTNYGHHTYHLPQGRLIHWIAFAVSMTEIVLLLSVLHGVVRAVGDRGLPGLLLRAGKGWTAVILVGAIPMCVPPLNALIHGTWLVAGHAMGAAIGIDTMTMLAACTWLVGEHGHVVDGRGPRGLVVALNLAVLVFVAWMHVVGLADGIARIGAHGAISGHAHRPAWLAASLYPVLSVSGGAVTLLASALVAVLTAGAWRGRLAPR